MEAPASEIMARGARPRVKTIGGGRGDRRRTPSARHQRQLWSPVGTNLWDMAVGSLAVEGGRLRQRMVAEADPVGDLSGDSRRR